MADKTESGYVKIAEAKIAAAKVFAENAQNEDRTGPMECKDFDVYFIEELKKVIVDSQKQLENTWGELDNLKQIMQMYEEEGKNRQYEFRKLHTEVAMELLLGMKNVLEDAKQARDIEKETTKDDVATLGMMAVYADLVGKVTHAFEKLMVY